MNASALVERLLLAVGGVDACSRSSTTIGPDSDGSAGSAGAPAATRKAEQKSGSGAGPTALCNDQLACVPGTWCSHYTSSRPDMMFGLPSMAYQCTGSGRFSTLPFNEEREAMRRPGPQVCLPREGECLDHGKPLQVLMARRYEASCGGFALDRTKAAAVRKNASGQDECCYEGRFPVCEGRPLLIGGRPRWAPLRDGAGWA